MVVKMQKKNGNGKMKDSLPYGWAWKDVKKKNGRRRDTRQHPPNAREPPWDWIGMIVSIFIWHQFIMIKFLVR